MMSWKGVDGTQKHRVPREGKAPSVTSGSGPRQLEETEQLHKYTKPPFHPRAFVHAIPSVWNALSLPTTAPPQPLAKWKPSPNPSQPPPPDRVGSFLLYTLRLLLLVCNYELLHVTVGIMSSSLSQTDPPGQRGSVSPT